MTGVIIGAMTFIGGILLLILGLLIKGAIAYFGKKGAAHVYENKDAYINKGKTYKEKYMDREKRNP